MEHFVNPRNTGEIEDPDAIGEVGNPRCGDIMKITMRVNDETETVEDIRFQTFGCGAAIAVSSIVTEMVKGKTLGEALAIDNHAVVGACRRSRCTARCWPRRASPRRGRTTMTGTRRRRRPRASRTRSPI